MFRFPMLAAMALSALVLTATARAQPQPRPAPKSGSSQPQPQPQPTDLAVTGLSVNEATERVAVTVRFDNRIGVRGVKVRVTVAGGGQVQETVTQLVDMAANSTQTVTVKMPFDAIKARIPLPPLQAVRFLTVTATVDPDNAIGEENETNNKIVRIVTFR